MVSPVPRYRESLTGNVRGRPRRFSRSLTLQVEVKVEVACGFSTLPCPQPPWCKDADEWKKTDADRIAAAWKTYEIKWRDATWADQLALP